VTATPDGELARLRRRGFWLECASLARMTVEAAVAIISGITSGAAPVGLGLSSWLGWWWADPAAALVIGALAIREGLEAWEDD
jgi:divalent metal cation (Fe/Co/Zn/Cd) transporter